MWCSSCRSGKPRLRCARRSSPARRRAEDAVGSLHRQLGPSRNRRLQALAAYCHFAVIYRTSPVGLPLPAVLAKANNTAWDEKLNRLLQELAWDAVTHHPLTGVKQAKPY